MIRLQNVCKNYGGSPALSNINLHIGLGEFAFLVGPSGAGKSTLMRLLYREEVPTSGNVLISGFNLNRLSKGQIPLLRRRLGIIFQDFLCNAFNDLQLQLVAALSDFFWQIQCFTGFLDLDSQKRRFCKCGNGGRIQFCI